MDVVPERGEPPLGNLRILVRPRRPGPHVGQLPTHALQPRLALPRLGPAAVEQRPTTVELRLLGLQFHPHELQLVLAPPHARPTLGDGGAHPEQLLRTRRELVLEGLDARLRRLHGIFLGSHLLPQSGDSDPLLIQVSALGLRAGGAVVHVQPPPPQLLLRPAQRRLPCLQGADLLPAELRRSLRRLQIRDSSQFLAPELVPFFGEVRLLRRDLVVVDFQRLLPHKKPVYALVHKLLSLQ
mmetsp:Transcript_66194/g.190248  ORF Transcript_66194/g.190248 Transcript_66194/m.190248 type:complete len:240 (-) Transcript_66194:331-1050(-)